MRPFLEDVADRILRQEGSDLRHVAIVTPSRRSQSVLRHYLAQKHGAALWAPRFFTIDRLACQWAGVELSNDLNLPFQLYEIHKRLEGERSLEEFLPIAATILSDFSDIDAYGIPVQQLFDYLHQIKVLEQWNVEGRAPSQTQERYLQFYARLLDYYNEINEQLSVEGRAYSGKAMRLAAEKAESYLAHDWPYKKTYLVGFNALSTVEQQLFDAFYHSGKGEALWDADAYYMEAEEHPAAWFLNRWKERYPKWFLEPERHFEIPKTLKISALPTGLAQAKYAAELIEKRLDALKPQARMVVVPADENLLLPLLYALSDRCLEKVNVTMGIPIRHTLLFDWVDAQCRLHENSERLQNLASDHSRRFYRQDVKAIVQNPLMAKMPDVGIKNGAAFFSPSDLKGLVAEEPTPKSLLENLEKWLSSFEAEDLPQLEKVALPKIQEAILHVQQVVDPCTEALGFRLLRKLLMQVLNPLNINILGDQEAPIQIMGLLETRTLDFDEVIILGVNEGVLPSSRNDSSMIPFDVKRNFGMPTRREHQALLSYHFYRLLQRAERIDLLYGTQTDPMMGGEKSRYIHQLLVELAKYQPQTSIIEDVVASPLRHDQKSDPIRIPKNADILKDLQFALSEKGLSYTSIRQFLDCPLQFYWSFVKGIREKPLEEDPMGPRLMGLLVHAVLEKLMRTYWSETEPMTVTSEIYDDILKVDLRQIILEVLQQQDGFSQFHSGKTELQIFVVEEVVRDFLKIERRFMKGKQLQIVGLEFLLERRLQLGDLSVRIKGAADRLDRVDGQYRLLDYKSGQVTDAELRCKAEACFADSKTSKAAQLLTYAWMFFNQFPEAETLFAGIVSTRHISHYCFPLEMDALSLVHRGHLVAYELQLTALIEEMLNVKLPFTPRGGDEQVAVCKNCSFRLMCGV